MSPTTSNNTISVSLDRGKVNVCRLSLNIQEFFGGKFESAKTDGRKEFQRMLNYIRQKRGKIRNILVYTTSRFSRTGGDAILTAFKIANNATPTSANTAFHMVARPPAPSISTIIGCSCHRVGTGTKVYIYICFCVLVASKHLFY